MISLDQTKLLSDLDLLCLLCTTEDDTGAYEEFVRRFYNDVKNECERRCKARKLDAQIGVQIAHDTFAKVRRHKTFCKDDVKSPNPRKAILAYLIRISVNLFNDHHRQEKKQNEFASHRSYFDDLFDVDSCQPEPSRLKEIKEMTLFVFKKLNPKEQKVILADVEHKRHQRYLPDDVTERLSIELQVKKETVRKIRERAIQKIKNGMDEYRRAI